MTVTAKRVAQVSVAGLYGVFLLGSWVLFASFMIGMLFGVV